MLPGHQESGLELPGWRGRPVPVLCAPNTAFGAKKVPQPRCSMAYNKDLAQRVRKVLAGQPGIVEKEMFGWIGFLLRGNMCCGVHRDELIVRVGPEEHSAALAKPHARPFDLTG